MKTRYLFASITGGAVGVALGMWLSYKELFPDEEVPCRTWSEIVESDTLRVATVQSTIGAFTYRGGMRGHEYEMAQQVCTDLGLKLQMIVAPTEKAMRDSLRTGVADVAAWPNAYSILRQEGGLRTCGYAYEQGMVLVAHAGVNLIDSVGEGQYSLAVIDGGRDYYCTKDEYVLEDFDISRFRIEVIPADSLTSESLTEGVMNGSYDATLLPINLATLLRTYYPDMVVGRPLVYSDDSVAWAVGANADTLAAMIDSVCNYDRSAPRYATVTKRYYEQSLGRQVKIRYLLGGGKLSVYDQLFRNYGKRLGWDWRLLAAVSFVESRFDPYEVSSKGARGLMQLMPATATRFGCPIGLLSDPESNVQAGARLIANMESSLRSRISRTIQPGILQYSEASPETRQAVEKDLICFTLASYNAGLGHVFDAIALADTLGYNPAVWEDNVEHCLRLKSDPTYYKMKCVAHGRFGARVTIDYVKEVLEYYDEFCKVAPK
ncbi:MAG: transglycosylase SLT domain-containing protein [Bacteroidales bacterium]|nr:transglycosylase SLT domain-containing protein [Bacteroidales bacterium]